MAWAAGFVDAFGWLLLDHVYSSHMTGNTASFATALADRNLPDALRHAWPMVPFVGGLLYSAGATALARRRGIHSSFSIALITEFVLLGLFVAAATACGLGFAPQPPLVFYGLLSALAAAMGIQTVTVTRVAGLRVYTTYLTGSLSKFAEAAIEYALWFRDRTRGRLARRLGKVLRVTPRTRAARHAALTAGLWVGFFTGAVCGALGERNSGLAALAWPMAVIAGATAVDLVRPVAAADEPTEIDSAH